MNDNIKNLHPNCVICVNTKPPLPTTEQAICSTLILIRGFGELYVTSNLCRLHDKMLEEYLKKIRETP